MLSSLGDPYREQVTNAIKQREIWSTDNKLDTVLTGFTTAVGETGIKQFTQNLQTHFNDAFAEMDRRANQIQPRTQCYHRSPHAAELAHDLKRRLEANPVCKNKKIQTLLISLATFAAVCHDIEQAYTGIKPIENERKSRDYFVDIVTEVINQTFPNDSEQKKQFIEAVKFIGDEFIVNGTTLVFDPKTKDTPHDSFMPLSHFILQQEETETTRHYSKVTNLIAQTATIIAAYDTTRAGDVNVLKQQTLLQREKPKALENLATRLFAHLGIAAKPKQQEAFLLLLTQNMRMMPELTPLKDEQKTLLHLLVGNPPRLRDQSFADCDQYRGQCQDLFKIFLDQSLANQLFFARNLQTNQYREIEAAYAPEDTRMLNKAHFDTGIWQKHAVWLEKLKSFYAVLTTENKTLLSQWVMWLTANQPGCELKQQLLPQNEPARPALTGSI